MVRRSTIISMTNRLILVLEARPKGGTRCAEYTRLVTSSETFRLVTVRQVTHALNAVASCAWMLFARFFFVAARTEGLENVSPKK
jgi:hypothetical protein